MDLEQALGKNFTEAELAMKYKKDMIEAIQPFIDLVNDARKDGFNVNVTFNNDFLGRCIPQINIIKQY
jgi:hypothetical protein